MKLLCLKAGDGFLVKPFLCTVFVCFAFAFATNVSLGQSIEQRLKSATTALQERRYDDAIREYQLALKVLPEQPEILSNLGIAYHLSGNYSEAIAAFRNALRIKPDLVAANLFLGIDYLKVSETDKAALHLQKVLRLDPQNAEARLALGTAHLSQRRYLQALEELGIASQSADDNPEVWYQLGKAYLKLGDDATNHIRELDPDRESLWARFLVAEVSSGRGKNELAGREFKSLASEFPSFPGVRAKLGELLMAQGQISKAEEQFKEELGLLAGNLDALFGLMLVALTKGELENAFDFVNQIIEIQPLYLTHEVDAQSPMLSTDLLNALIERVKKEPTGQASSHFMLSYLYGQRGSLEDSQKYFHLFSSLTPAKKAEAAVCSIRPSVSQGAAHYPRSVHLFNASCFFLQGAHSQSLKESSAVLAQDSHNLAALFWQSRAAKELAVRAFQRLVVADPASFRVHQLQGQIHVADSQLDEGVEAYQRAIQLNPGFSALHLELGMVYRDQLKYDLAMTTVGKALESTPSDPETNYVLGDIYVKANKSREAIPYLERALEKSPNYSEAMLTLAKAYRAEGRIEEAVTQFKAALPLDRNGEIHYQLSSLYRQLGRLKEAREEIETFQKIREERLASAREKGVYGLN